MNKKIGAPRIILFLGLVLAFFLKAGFVLALEITYPAFKVFGQNFSLNNSSSLAEFVCYFMGLITDLAFFIAILVIAWGGVQYLFTLGIGKIIDPTKGTRAPDEAKEWVKAGVSGLLLVVCVSLIAYTINPNLTTCKVGLLSLVGLNSSGGSEFPPGANLVTYKEIPIGTLTENLLTGKIDCYGFNSNGDPIPGKQILTNESSQCDDNSGCHEQGETCDIYTHKCGIDGPTYIDHDKLDCIVQMVKGAQKKVQAIMDLSTQTNSLMAKCKCDASTCSADGSCGGFSPCSGFPTPNTCQQASNTADCCPMDSSQKDKDGNVILIPVKNEIEQNLDEFRCPNPNDKKNDVTPPPIITWLWTPEPSDTATPCDGPEIISFVEKQIQTQDKTYTVIDLDKWNKLNLWQQLQYFREKMTENSIGLSLRSDLIKLQAAKSALAKCYLAIPYVDFAKKLQNTNQQDTVIMKDPESFRDANGNYLSVAKYCKGFNYGNSSCFQKCNNMCPDASQDAIQAYKQCDGKCKPDDKNCLNAQELCIEQAYNDRPCIYGGNASGQNFLDCISSCQSSCTENCKELYPDESSDAYKKCNKECSSDDSKCLFDPSTNNEAKCLFGDTGINTNGAQGFVDCANKNETNDPGNSTYCIDRAYACKNGSDEYSGYPDCVVPSDCSTITDGKDCSARPECVWVADLLSYEDKPIPPYCAQNSSSDFLFKNPTWQRCPPSSDLQKKAVCQKTYPETAKCLANSKCPSCPCGIVTSSAQVAVPTNVTGVYNIVTQTYSNKEMTSIDCNEYSYNDDPLTFYCQDDWYNDPNKEGTNPTPIGTERIASLKGEIPVGETVDNAEYWAISLVYNSGLDKTLSDMKLISDDMKKIGDAKDDDITKDYCECGARYASDSETETPGDPVCTSSCVPVLIVCGTLCQGGNCSKPCQQMTDYFTKLWLDYGDFQLNFKIFNTSAGSATNEESDILKQLTYSRKSMNDCSLKTSAYGTNTRPLSCTRVEDELIPDVTKSKVWVVNGYCYGNNLGKLYNPAYLPFASFTDNWFCAEEHSKNPTPGQ